MRRRLLLPSLKRILELPLLLLRLAAQLQPGYEGQHPLPTLDHLDVRLRDNREIWRFFVVGLLLGKVR